MFGYIRTERGELRLREYEYYRATYCGLCRSMGKCTGQCSRMSISYDVAFLANVRMLLLGTTTNIKKRGCFVHPFRKRAMMEPNDELCYAAYASAILAYEKCRDDVADERGARRAKARFRRAACYGAYRRARKAHPVLSRNVREHLEKLSRAQAKREGSVDALAAIFGELLGDVFAHGLSGNDARLARKIGYETGRFIYILDALDDLEKDAKRGEFNPLLLLYGEQIDEELREGVRTALLQGLCDLEAAFDLLPQRDDPTAREVLNNILYLGMPHAIDRVLEGERERKRESKSI